MESNYYKGFNSRRKRNVQAGSHYKKQEEDGDDKQYYGIRWENQLEMPKKESLKNEEDMNWQIEEQVAKEAERANQEIKAMNHLTLDGQPFKLGPSHKKQKFADTHVRFTTYLEKEVHQIIQVLQKQGQLDSITKLVNDSIKTYLMSEYNDIN